MGFNLTTLRTSDQGQLVEGPMVIQRKLGCSGTTRRHFEGLQQYIIAKANLLESQFYDCTITEGVKGAVWSLDAVAQYDISKNNGSIQDPLPDPVWEISTALSTRAFLESDRTIIKGLSSNTKECIEYRLKHPQSNNPLTSAADISQLPNATIVYQILQLGIEGKLEFVDNVKMTITVNNYYLSNWTNANKGKVLSKPQLVAQNNVPSYISPLLSDNLSGRLQPLDTISNISDSNYYKFYGFLQHPRNYVTVGSNKVQISTEWQYGAWATALYDIIQ